MSNNFENFIYNNSNQILFKSKRISKYKINDLLLFEKNNLITSDQKGNIIIYSISDKKVISKFNFYKKKFKKIEKKLNLILENNIIYVSDNLGYLYAYNYKENTINWAKNYKIPFRSNLKISKNKLFAANINNNLIILNKKNGDVLKSIPTEENLVQNKFINNLSQTKNLTFFLNTYGSLYAIENDKMNINWFMNLNRALDLNPSNLFYSNQIVSNNNVVVVTANQFTYVIDIKTGSIIYKINLTSSIKPLITEKYLFLVSGKSLLISFDLKTGKIIYSYNINQKIAEFLNSEEKEVQFKNMFMANNKILIFLKNSFILKFNINGVLEEVQKLPSKINTSPIFIDGSFLFLDFKKKLSIIN
tara:strand:- start:889 stop:1971 length:1083 start_codon:yes stop_codon:yes gene_type:complete